MREVSAEIKQDPQKRWELNDKDFFACGACHILAYVLLKNFDFQCRGYTAIWIKPKVENRGNHIYISDGKNAIDWQGIQKEIVLLKKHKKYFFEKFPRWDYETIKIETNDLISEEQSLKYDGLHLRQPNQFLHNPIPRAVKYILDTILKKQ